MIRKLSTNRIIFLAFLFTIGLLVLMNPSQNAMAENCKSRPVVRLNDSLQRLAQKNKVTPMDLIQANKLVGPDYPIYVGQRLCIPAVKSQDTLWKIEPYMTHPAGYFIIDPQNFNSVLVKTTYFAPFSTYRVWMETRTGTMVLAGVFTTGKNGNASAKIPRPQGVKSLRAVKTCIQDSQGTVMLCKNVRF